MVYHLLYKSITFAEHEINGNHMSIDRAISAIRKFEGGSLTSKLSEIEREIIGNEVK